VRSGFANPISGIDPKTEKRSPTTKNLNQWPSRKRTLLKTAKSGALSDSVLSLGWKRVGHPQRAVTTENQHPCLKRVGHPAFQPLLQVTPHSCFGLARMSVTKWAPQHRMGRAEKPRLGSFASRTETKLNHLQCKTCRRRPRGAHPAKTTQGCGTHSVDTAIRKTNQGGSPVGPSFLFAQAHPTQQLLETWIASQRIESGIHPDSR